VHLNVTGDGMPIFILFVLILIVPITGCAPAITLYDSMQNDEKCNTKCLTTYSACKSNYKYNNINSISQRDKQSYCKYDYDKCILMCSEN